MKILYYITIFLLVNNVYSQSCTNDLDCSTDCSVLKKCISGSCTDVDIYTYCGIDQTACMSVICGSFPFPPGTNICIRVEECPTCTTNLDCISNCHDPRVCIDGLCYPSTSYEYCGVSIETCQSEICLSNGTCNPDPGTTCQVIIDPNLFVSNLGQVSISQDTIIIPETSIISIPLETNIEIIEVRYDYVYTESVNDGSLIETGESLSVNVDGCLTGCVSTNEFLNIVEFCEDATIINCITSDDCPDNNICVSDGGVLSGICENIYGSVSTNCNFKRSIEALNISGERLYIYIPNHTHLVKKIANVTYTKITSTDKGCAKGWGYWKNTKKRNCSIQEIGGESLEQVLHTPPQKGNAYYILAYQLAGVSCDQAEGYALYSSVDTQNLIENARNFIDQHSNDKLILPGHPDRQKALLLAYELATLNEGKGSIPSCAAAVIDQASYDYIMLELEKYKTNSETYRIKPFINIFLSVLALI